MSAGSGARPLAGGVDDLGVGQAGDAAVAVGHEVLHGTAGAARVVEEHRVGGDPARRPVQEHRRGPGAELADEVGVVLARGHDEHGVDPAAQQGRRQLPLALGVLGARARDEQEPAGLRHGLDGLGDEGVEGVGEVLDDQPERRRRAALAQAAREVVALEAEGADGRGHPGRRLGGDAGLAVDHARDGLQAHARPSGDVPHRGSRCTHISPPPPRAADNVVNHRGRRS
jgi:hypothetical protein